ncbi:MAG: hypothetical protein CW691_04380 [Candidatus Bathyarchaeum sp.]|nr:MAG: hypothetical protein CW691_04380 [Candidatus Bathyarchaeum sp.]
MKRSITMLGRLGTVLVAISLALILVSLIPQLDLLNYQVTRELSPEQVFASGSQALSPQQGFGLKVTTEDTINIYLLEISNQDPLPEVNLLFDNATELQEFLDANPELIIWENNLENEQFEESFTPTKVVDVTLVFYNPTSEVVTVDYELTLTSSVAPKEKVQNISLWTTLIGIILAIPWLVNRWKQRKQN